MSLWQLRQFGSRAFVQDLQQAEEAFKKECLKDRPELVAPPSSRFSPPESLASFSATTPGGHEALHHDDACSSCSLGEVQEAPFEEPLESLSEGEASGSGTGRRPRATD